MKISLSVPEDVLRFVEKQGKNRSKTIVTILSEYKKLKEESIISEAYKEYEAYCKTDDNSLKKDWEKSSINDLTKGKVK